MLLKNTAKWKTHNPTRREFLRTTSLVPLGGGLVGYLLANPPKAVGGPTPIPTQALVSTPTPIGKLEHGIGFNWFDETAYGRPDKDAQGYPVCPDLNDKTGWSAMMEAMDDLRPGIIRFWLNPDDCVGERKGEIKTEAVCLQRAARVQNKVREAPLNQ